MPKRINAHTMDELHQEIEALKKMLHLRVKEHDDLCHPEVISVSKRLDQLIMKVMKLQYHQKKDHITF